MRLIDAHVHLSEQEYEGHIDELIEDAKNAGVVALVTNATNLKTCQNDIALAEKYPNIVYPALGIHRGMSTPSAKTKFKRPSILSWHIKTA